MSKLSCFARQRVIYDRGEPSDTSMRVRFTRDLLQFSFHSMAASAQRSRPNTNSRGREARQPRFDWVLPYVWQRGYHFHFSTITTATLAARPQLRIYGNIQDEFCARSRHRDLLARVSRLFGLVIASIGRGRLPGAVPCTNRRSITDARG